MGPAPRGTEGRRDRRHIDEGQRVFNRHGSPPVPLVPLVLDHTLRNTRQIANAFQPLVDHPMRILGGEGPAVKVVACAREDAMDAGDDEVELFLEDGWRPEDVALLTTGARHPEQKDARPPATPPTGTASGTPSRSSTVTSWASKALSAARWYSSSTRSQRSNGPANASTSDCPAPVTNSSCAAIPTSYAR